MIRLSLLLTLLVAAMAVPTQAADFSDPTWPCIQRKVPRLSIGQMWAGPPIAAEADWRKDEAVRRLAPLLAARRTSLEEADRLITDFAAAQGEDRGEKLALLFQGAFSLIDRERGELIEGIGRYAQKQTGLSQQIEARRAELSKLMAEEEPSLDQLDLVEELEDNLAWEVRIYADRAQSLTYVCETPVLLEKRAFALARSIMNQLP